MDTFTLGEDWRNIETHRGRCKFERVRCNDCGDDMLRDRLTVHKSGECVQRMVECKLCAAPIRFSMMKEHTDCELGCKDCKLCPNGCTTDTVIIIMI
jgi:hypothetical protein